MVIEKSAKRKIGNTATAVTDAIALLSVFRFPLGADGVAERRAVAVYGRWAGRDLIRASSSAADLSGMMRGGGGGGRRRFDFGAVV